MDVASHVQKLGTILGVWAHPDDEVFTCGGVMALAAANGQQVMCMTATRGEAGVQDEARWPAARLGKIRSNELEAAYEKLGVLRHCWFDYPDGGLTAVPDKQGFKMIEQCIDECNPDSIITFGPDGMTGHPDHKAVSKWATKIGQARGIKVYHVVMTPEEFEANKEADAKFNMFFNIDSPPIVPVSSCDLCITLDEETLEKKCQALKVMPSQTERLFALGEEKLKQMQKIEAFVRAK